MAHGSNPVKSDFLHFYRERKKKEKERKERKKRKEERRERERGREGGRKEKRERKKKKFYRDQIWPTKPKNIYHLTLHRKSLPISDLET